MEWKKEFEKQWSSFYIGNFIEKSLIETFITNLLEEQKKYIIQELLSESPNEKYLVKITIDPKTGKGSTIKCKDTEYEEMLTGFNQSNLLWKHLLQSKLK